MFFRRFSLVLVTAVLTFGVVKPSFSFAPAFAGVAFNSTVGRAAATFVVEGLVLDVIARGLSLNDPFYAAKAKISKSRLTSWLKSPAARRNAVIASVVAGLALSFDNDGNVVRSTVPNDPMKIADHYWRGGGTYSSPHEYAAFVLASSSVVGKYSIERVADHIPESDSVYVQFYYATVDKVHSRRRFDFYPCTYGKAAETRDVATCQSGYSNPPAYEVVPDTDFYSLFANALAALSSRQIDFAFSDGKGNIEPSIAEILEVPEPALMPDDSPIPAIGSQSWQYADWVARGIAQSTDSAVDYYVSPLDMPDATYLVNEIAQGNQTITKSNAGNTPIVTPDPNPQPIPIPEGGFTVDFGTAPNVSAPTLEQPPTGQQILNPLLGLFPSLTGFSAPQQVGECPRPTFSYFGESYSVEAHCDLFQQHAGIISSAMLLVFSIFSLRIVLSA